MNSGNERKTEGIDRRKFLMRAAAAGTAAALRPAGVFAQDSGDRRDSIPNNFTRIFDDLRPFAELPGRALVSGPDSSKSRRIPVRLARKKAPEANLRGFFEPH